MEISSILQKHRFFYKKSLGQNFITDGGLLHAIVRDAGVTPDDVVLEIGTGAGTLTRALAESAKQVFSFDVDRELEPILSDTLQGLENVEVIFKDVLKMSDAEIAEITGGRSFKVVANLPYYITTPLLMRFIESTLPLTSITVMVQKEVADRLTAIENTADYGAITLGVRMRGDAVVTRTVPSRMFYPQPKVDSAVVTVKIDDNKYEIKDKKLLSKLIKCGFAMRRKTLVNNLSATFGISKEDARERLIKANLPENVRGEVLSLEDYIKLSEVFLNF